MAKYAIMPAEDYTAICDAIREGTGTADPIKSGEAAGMIQGIIPNTCTLRISDGEASTWYDICSIQAVVYENGTVNMYERRQNSNSSKRINRPLTIENVVCGSYVVMLIWRPSMKTIIGMDLNSVEKYTTDYLTHFIGDNELSFDATYEFIVFRITASAGETATITITASELNI